MKKFNSILIFSLYAALCMAFGSCSSDKTGDLREILLTVPSDVSFVGVADLEHLLDETDCKVKKGEVIPGKKIQKIFEDSSDPKLEFVSQLVTNGGIDPSYLVFFTVGYNTYATGFLSDTDKFKTLMEQHFGETAANNGDISSCGNVAFTSNRFWACISSRSSINTNDVKHFIGLSDKQSFIISDNSAKLISSDADMRGWGDIKGCLNAAGLDFSTRASVMMAFEALFEDAIEFSWDMDLDKDKMEINLTLLNSKGGIAAFLYPTAEVNVNDIKNSNLSGDAMALLAISPKFTQKMREDTRGKGMSVIGMLSGMISDVSGTLIVASDGDSNISGIIPVIGNNTSDLNQMLAQYDFSVTKDKNALRFSKGDCSGKLSADVVASVFKGKMGGLILSPEPTTAQNIEYAAFTLNPDKGGMEIEVEVKGTSKESLIIGLLKLIN